MADFAAVGVHWTTEVHLATWLGELLPADTLDHRDVGGRAMSGTLAEVVNFWNKFSNIFSRQSRGALAGTVALPNTS